MTEFKPQDYVSIVYNFVCTHDSRLKHLLEQVPKIAELFKGYKFYVNYNTYTNINPVSEVFHEYIHRPTWDYTIQNNMNSDLFFRHDVTKDWVGTTLSLLDLVKTPYFMYLTEDMVFDSTPEDWTNMFKEMVDNDVKHVMVSKIRKYTNKESPYFTNFERHVIEGDYIYMYEAQYYPTKTLSTLAVNDVEFFKGILFKEQYYSTYKSPNIFERRHQNIKSYGEMLCGIPKKIITEQHHEDGVIER